MNTLEMTGRLAGSFDSKEPICKPVSPASAGFNELDLNALIDLVIKQYHFNARKDIAVIYDLANAVFSRHCEKHPELAKLCEELFLFFDDLSFHFKKEEQILFPNIIQLNEMKLHEAFFNYSTFGVIKECTLTMQQEHRDVIEKLGFFRQLTNNYTVPEDASETYRSLFVKMKAFEKELIAHIDLENDLLFPKAVQMDENKGR